MLECAGIHTNIFSGHSPQKRSGFAHGLKGVGSLSITSHNRTHTLVERCCHQQANLRSEVATNNTLICETEPYNSNGSGHEMAASYSGLYEEGEV